VNNQPEKFHLHKADETVSFHVHEGCPGTTVEISVRYKKTGISRKLDLRSLSEARIIWAKYQKVGYEQR